MNKVNEVKQQLTIIGTYHTYNTVSCFYARNENFLTLNQNSFNYINGNKDYIM